MSRKSMMTFLGNCIVVALCVLNISAALGQGVPMIVFTSDRDGDEEVFIMFGNGEVQQLTKNGERDIDPIFSADGNTIVYSSNER